MHMKNIWINAYVVSAIKATVGVLKIIEHKNTKAKKHPKGLLWIVGENYCRKPELTSAHISKFNTFTERSSFDPIIISETEDPKLGDFVFDEETGDIGEVIEYGVNENTVLLNSFKLKVKKQEYPKILYKTTDFPEQFIQDIVDGVIEKDSNINIECFEDDGCFKITHLSKVIKHGKI